MKHLSPLLVIFLLFANVVCNAQSYIYSSKIDSLISIANSLPNDSNRVILLNKITDNLWRKSHLDSANVYGQMSLEIARDINYKIGEGNVLTSIGIINAIKGNYPKASAAMENSLQIFIEVKDKSKIAGAYNNLGNISEKKGDYADALEYHLKSLNLKEEMGDTIAMSSSYNNIGIALKYQGDNVGALKYYTKALAINKSINNTKAIAQANNNMGSVYQDMTLEEINKMGLKNQEECYAASLYCYNKSLDLNIEVDDKVGTAISFNNIGSLYFIMGEYSKALTYNEAALGMRQEIGDKSGQSGTLCNLSKVYLKLNQNEVAKTNADESLEIALEIGAKDRIKNSYKIHSEVDSALGDFESAYLNYKYYTLYDDSISNEENMIKSTQLKMQFDFDKKAAADSATNAKMQELKNFEIDKNKAELAKQDVELESKKTQQYYLFGGLLLVFVFAGFIYNRFRVSRKQNKLIASQNKQVEHKNMLVEKAHGELTEKNKEIMDSIAYAKRIQAAILPPKKMIDQLLGQAFVFYKPKDIVAGDFYWLESRDGRVLYAAADCTGHGVPGAMVSVICNNGLNRSVREYGLTTPSQILDKTREIVIQEFEKSEEEVSDGMDISLCSVDFKSLKLEWSGANNPLILVREGELIEIKPDKQPIGKYINAKPFMNHELDLQNGDVIYTFTDGFQDQFGGEKGKKYLYKRFKALLLENSGLEVSEQQDRFLSELNSWKGVSEQVDDICIIGVKI